MDEVPLEKVELQADVYMVCLQHALSTENFEVMGLLIGNVSTRNTSLPSFASNPVAMIQLSEGVANISAVKILRRSDKKKDRVEISSEQLLKAAAEAERLEIELDRPMRVLGWYHSHPHITVWPSHVGEDQDSSPIIDIIDPILYFQTSELKLLTKLWTEVSSD